MHIIKTTASILTKFCIVKVGPPEIGKIVRYLPDKKIGSHSCSRFGADRTQNLSGPAPDNILRVPQITSKSIHFRRSYSQTWTSFKRATMCFQYSAKLQLLPRVKTWLMLIINSMAWGQDKLPKCLDTWDLRHGNYSSPRYYINRSIPFINLAAQQKKKSL